MLVQRGGNVGSRGDYEDAGIQIGASQNTTTWKTGLQFGAYKGDWPFATDSTMILAQQGLVGTPVALNGVDFRSVTFGGYAFASSGFTVDGSGNLTGANLTATGTIAITSTSGTSTIAAGQGFTIGGTQLVLQQSSGNVGIGTNAPSSNLTISKGGAATFRLTTGADAFIINKVDTTGVTLSENYGTMVFAIAPTNGGTPVEAMRVAQGGLIGIGTSSPTNRLEVAGNTFLGGNLTATGTLSIAGTSTHIGLVTFANGFVSQASSTVVGDFMATGFHDTSAVAGGYKIDGKLVLTASSTLSNISIGYLAGAATTTTGTNNIAIGLSALSQLTSGTTNVVIGNGAGGVRNTAGANTLIGYQAGGGAGNGSNNSFIGYQAGTNHGGSGNTALGYQSLNSGGGAVNNNVAIGFQSGFLSGTGSNNVFLGTYAASTTVSGANNIVLGYDIALPVTNGSNQLNIGNLIFGTGINGEGMNVSTGNIAIGTTTPYARLTVWGPDNTASTTAFLVANSASTTEFAVLDNGNALIAGNLIQNSDQRLKTNIAALDASSSLSAINALNPVTFNWIDPAKGSVPQYGFIAQQALPIFPDLVSTTSATALTPGGTLSFNYIGLIAPIVKAIQQLDAELASLASTVAGFAQSFTTHVLTAATGHFSNQLCVGSTCVTPQQFQAMVAAANQSSSSAAPSPSSNTDVSSTNATDTPPVISINGDNPATIEVGATYSDLGATITAPQADLNLGIHAFVDDAATTTMNAIQIDTSKPGTHTITYLATDQNGHSGTITRTIKVTAEFVAQATSSADENSN